MRRSLLYGNVIVDSSNSTALGGTLTISNSCKTSSLNNQASIAFAVADISYGVLKKGLFMNGVDSADARITAIIDTVSPTVGTALSVSVSPNTTNPPVEALRVQSNGNVGIGTQTPAYSLDVNGNIRVGSGITGNIRFGSSGVGTTQAGYIDLINNNMTILNQQNGNIIIGTNNVEDMRISQTGNVGIGTQTPAYPLDVNGNIRLGSGTTGNIRFGSSGVGTTQAGYIDLINNNMTILNQQNGNIIIGTNNAEDMRILTNGNVGIGTQTPAYPLDVNGNIRLGSGTTGNIRFGSSGVGTTQAGYIDLISNNMTIMNQQNGNIIIGTNNVEDIRILQNGNVGIGTQTPAYPLHVEGNLLLNGTMYSQSTPGVWVVNGSTATIQAMFPLFRSCANVNALYPTSGTVVGVPAGGSARGTFLTINFNDVEDYYIVMPGYGIVAWSDVGWLGSSYLNVYNNTDTPRAYLPTTVNNMTSFKIYYNNVEIS